DAERERNLVQRLIEIPALIEKTLTLDATIHELAKRFADKHHTLFLGRGALSAIAMEGALKLKEISYIHAEAYAAVELKHGPLAHLQRCFFATPRPYSEVDCFGRFTSAAS